MDALPTDRHRLYKTLRMGEATFEQFEALDIGLLAYVASLRGETMVTQDDFDSGAGDRAPIYMSRNAGMAASELGRRDRAAADAQSEAQLKALEDSSTAVAASNAHMRSTATWTMVMGIATIVAAAAAVFAGVYTVTHDDSPPCIVVTTALPDADLHCTVVAPPPTTG